MEMQRFAYGFACGVAATLAMSAVMLAGVVTGMSPMPSPVPVALVSAVLGEGVAPPLLFTVAVIAHLAYGGIWGGALALAVSPVTIGTGMGFGVFLWLLMQTIVLPFLGWGAFGAAVAPAVAVATLVLHLVYGGTLGWLMDRRAITVGS